MRKIHLYGPTIVLLAGLVLVMFVGPRIVRTIAHAHTDARIEFVADSLDRNPTLAELSAAFRKVGEVVEPSVVHVEVYRKQQGRRMSEDALRRWFFEGRPPTPERRDDGGDRFRDTDPLRPGGNGSGWVYDGDGHIVTNYHVIENADRIVCRFHDESEREATVVASDRKTDIAVLKVEGGNVHPARVAKEPAQRGDIVFAFGSPFGSRFKFSMTQGIVSARGRELEILDPGGYENFIQTDAAINPGNSGGPLTNIRGEVVGMNTAIATGRGGNPFGAAGNVGLGFAIPVGQIEQVVTQLLEEGQVRRGYLGVYIDDDRDKLETFGYSGRGVLVDRPPIAGGPADDAGLQMGDIIVEVEGKKVPNVQQLRWTIASYPPGKTVSLKVFRDGEMMDVDVRLGELPGERPTASRGPETDDDIDGEALGRLGLVRVAEFTEELAAAAGREFIDGVVVVRVRPGSVAAINGIRRGDVITHVAGESVATPAELAAAISEADISRGIRMQVHDGESRRFVVLKRDIE